MSLYRVHAAAIFFRATLHMEYGIPYSMIQSSVKFTCSHSGFAIFHFALACMDWWTIIEYGSSLYVGMTQEKNGGPIKCVQNLMFRTLPWM